MNLGSSSLTFIVTLKAYRIQKKLEGHNFPKELSFLNENK